MSLELARIPVQSTGAEGSRFGQEFVLLDPAGRMLRGLNETGARIWALIDGKRSVAEIATVISREFDVPLVTAQADVAGFISLLVGHGLVVVRDEAGRAVDPQEGKK